MASRPVWSRSRPQITRRCRMAAWHVFLWCFWCFDWEMFLSPLAGCNDRGTWCLIQFTSVHVQMAVTRPLSLWRDLEFLSLQDMAPLCHFVAISLLYYIVIRFHFRTSILSVFSRRPRWFSRPQNEGPETRCIQLVTSHDRHSSNMLNYESNQSVNENTVFFTSLCSLRSLSISKAKVRSHSGIDSNFRTWTWHNMRWVRCQPPADFSEIL